jgi:integrase
MHSHTIGKTQADKHVNTQLTRLADQLTDIHADLERQGKPVTARAIYRLYQTDGATLSLLELYDAFLAERKTLIGVEISESSYKVTVWRRQVLVNFLEAKKLIDLRPEEFTHNLADKFIHWGLTEKSYKRNNINKALQNVVGALRWAVRRELLDKNPVEMYKYKAAIVAEIKYLNAGDLQQLTALESLASYLEKTRDCFVFQCWTGLAHADLVALDIARDAEYHRDKGTGGLRRVLRITRAKSTMQKGYECVIPLLPEAERILAKYEDELPVVYNQLYNRHLKEIGQLCGFEADKMTSHVGRKTAGVMMLNLGIRMETVSKFLGHSSTKMTEKIYAKILDTTVVDDFSKLFGGPPAPAPRVYELPAPAPERVESVALRPARRITQPSVEVLPEPPSEDNRWRRPPPTTSRQGANQPSVRVVQMWAEPTTGKEALSA